MEWLISLGNAFQNPATYIDALTLGSIYALIAVGYTMVYGIIKLINFAHGEIIMLGTYIAFLVVTGLNVPIVVAMLIAMLACAAVGATIDWTAYLPLRRSKGRDPVTYWAILRCRAVDRIFHDRRGWRSNGQNPPRRDRPSRRTGGRAAG
jgi:hypothetical protein